MPEGLRCLSGAIGEAEWLEIWRSCPEREPFTHPSFLRAFAEPGARPTCLLFSHPLGQLHYPCLVRDLKLPPFETDAVDALGPPMVWGGPFVTRTTNREGLIRAFYIAYQDWARDMRCVTEYLSFSPLSRDFEAYPGDVEVKLPIVVRELSSPLDEITNDYEHKVRKNVARARNRGLRVEVDRNGRYLGEFLDIYYDTMKRRQAPARFYFSRALFELLIREVPDACTFFHVWDAGSIVSTELILTGPRTMYSFLGGTSEAAFAKRPNDLLKHEAITWGRETNRTHFVLGGGAAGEDGIFKYKRAFAPTGVVPLRVGRWEMNQEACHQLVSKRRQFEARNDVVWNGVPGFFPSYRAPNGTPSPSDG